MDKLKEECGVVGIYSKQRGNIGERIYHGLISLQHRGQESAGIATWHYDRIMHYKHLGLVQEVFNQDNLTNLTGHMGIGHVRYSTTGAEDDRKNAQPLVQTFKGGDLALAHNGNIINAMSIRDEMVNDGHSFHTTIDSEIIIRLIAKNYQGDAFEAIKKACGEIKGAYALVIMLGGKLYGVRDPHGFRPLVLGSNAEGDYILSSETATLDLLDARRVGDVSKGEIIEISDEGVRREFFNDKEKKALCSFEYVYFSRPDSTIDGKYVFSVRKNLGAKLAQKDEKTYDVVAPVPDSGIPAAIGYAHEKGMNYTNVLMKNKYIGRTFISPNQEQRDIQLRLKLNVLTEEVKGKSIVLIDDSIVRGTTMKKLIFQLKDAGAREVHVRISSPPVMHSCYFGIDTPSKKSLIGANYSVEEICKHIGADSLKFLTPDDLVDAIGDNEALCRACFTGEYPMEVPKKSSKYIFEKV